MRKLIFPIAFIGATSLVACSFQMGAGTRNNPNSPQNGQQAAQPNQPAQPNNKQPLPPRSNTLRKVGKRTTGPVGPTPSPSTPPSTDPSPAPAPSVPPGVPLVNAPTIFGHGTTPTSAAWKGNIYFVAAGATKLPDFTTAKPNGFLWANELNVTPQAFTTGFPGVDPAKKDNFAIRYEAPLTVTGETQDWDFRLVSDDGAVLSIDGMKIVENDGVKTAPAEKTGPVRLTPATHVITVDYFQTTGNVALQVYCKKVGETADKICPLSLN